MKTFWAAVLAFIVANILLIIIGFIFIASIASLMGDSAPVVKSNSVLKIDLASGIVDSPPSSPFDVGLFGVSFGKSNTMLEVISAIEKASVDPDIKGIVIDLAGTGSVSLANTEELRQAVGRFRDEGKFVVSYGDSYSQGGYYLASVADVVLLNPAGDLDWRGISSSVMFYKGLLDKLGIKAEILRHGTFKAAVEPFMLQSMSPENRLQTSTMIGSIWDALLDDVSASRAIDKEVLSNYASDLAVRSARHAQQYGLVDALAYRDQAQWLIGELVKGESPTVALARMPAVDAETLAKADKLETISLSDYIATGVQYGSRSSKNKVAVIYAEGDIVDGEGSDGQAGGLSVAARIARARKDDRTKAIILRVNSPGGSALASEVIWREMELARQTKPVIVSMGGMAASGGYYISCPADIILSDRMTLTGSIGVFGIMFDISGTLRDKLGITTDVVRTNPSADFGSQHRSPTAHERETIMYSIEEIYNTFVGHVADGRNMTPEAVDAIGGGRVWSGVNALEIGLVDGFGGLKDAISLAADRAGIAEDFRVWQVVEDPITLSSLLKDLGGIRTRSLSDELGELFLDYRAVLNMVSEPGVKARVPYNIELN